MKQVLKLALFFTVLGLTPAFATSSIVAVSTGASTTLDFVQDSVTGRIRPLSVLGNPADGTLIPINPCQAVTTTPTPILYKSTGSSQIVAGTSGKNLAICSIFLFTGVANKTAIVQGSGTNCGTGTAAAFGGGITAADGFDLIANQGFSHGNGGYVIGRAAAATGNNICLITSASTVLTGEIVTAPY